MITLESKRDDGQWIEPKRNGFRWPDGTNLKQLCKKLRKSFPNSLASIRLAIGNGSGKEKTFIYFV